MGWLSGTMQKVSRRKRSKKPSLYDLRMRLSNLAEKERDGLYARYIACIPDKASRDYNLAHLNLGLSLSNRAIARYQRDTLLAVIEASEHPSYSLIDTMREDSDAGETSTRDTALFFGTLHQLGISNQSRHFSLFNLSQMSGVSDLSSLHARSPEGANALLRISHFASTRSEITANEPMHPELLEMVMLHPEKTEALIEFIEERRVTSLADLHPQIFLDAMSTESQSMRGGVL